MLNQQVNLFHTPFEEIFSVVRNQFSNSEYDFKKHLINLMGEDHEALGYIRLPLHISLSENIEFDGDEVTVLYLSIEAGSAALCLQKGKQTLLHTTFSSYMSRKKQGFSQIKYLNKKGKSRAGSRVRLASTLEFFEDINSKLTTLLDAHKVERIALNITPGLVPYLHQSKVPCPFEKQDIRLYKIPLHITQSNFTNLYGVIKKLMAPILFYDEKYEGSLNVFNCDNQ